MLRDYFRTNFRALWKNRGQSLINVLGLTLGIICTMIIFVTVRFELSYDTFNEKASRIYRVVTERKEYGEVFQTAGITYPLPEAVRQDFADAELVTIMDQNVDFPVMGITQPDGTRELFKEEKFAYVDPEFFSMFDYDWIEGTPKDALTKEKTVVLSESIAKKYFGDKPAVGRVINCSNKYDLTVSGVVKDPRPNSSLPFNVLISFRLGADKHGWEQWNSTSSSLNCYVLLKEGVSKADFEAKMKGWHLKYFKGDDKESGEARVYSLQPLGEIHFDTRYDTPAGRVVTYETLIALSLIGALLLITACINFINLNTVLIINRAKEVGVRKVMGSGRRPIVLQFLGETFFITLIAMALSLALMEVALINLRPVLGFNVEFHPMEDRVLLGFIVALPFLVTILAGLYPAFSMAAFQPIKALKSKLYGARVEGVTLRRTLITVQLIIAQAMVISTIIIVQQLDLFMSQPLGLNSSAVVEFDLPERQFPVLNTLKQTLLSIPGVQSVSMSNTGSASNNTWGGDFDATVKNQSVKANAQIKFADEDYLKTYGLTLLSGTPLPASDTTNKFIVNEAFVRAAGLKNEDAVGTPVHFWGRSSQIQGVVRDFNTTSLHSAISPVIIATGKERYSVCAVKLQTKDIAAVMTQVEKTWKQSFPNFVFEYSFLDDTIAKFYIAEQRTSKLVMIFACAAILIGTIGLLGLVSFMVTKRTKEVGIRKTLGASISSIMILFSREFVILILVSFAASAPIANYVLSQWLGKFAYRFQPGVFTFLTGMALSMIVVLGTVGFMSYKAATANPVLALKDE